MQNGLPPRATFIADIGEALSDTGIDAELIATPANTHAYLAKECIEAGKHVLVAKPLAVHPDDCRDLKQLSLQRGTILMAGHTTLFHKGVQALRQLCHGRQIHRITCIRRGVGRIQNNTVIDDLAVHDLANILFITGRDILSSRHRHFSHGPAAKSSAMMLLNLAGGAQASIEASWTAESRSRLTCVHGDGFACKLDELAGALSIYSTTQDRHLPGADFTASLDEEIILDKADMLEDELLRFAGCIEQGEYPHENIDIASNAMRTIFNSREITE